MITSKDNDQIKHILKLQTKKYRDQHQAFLIYGEHAISEAKKQGFELDIYTSNLNQSGTLISETLMKQLSVTESPMDVVAIVKKPSSKPISKRILMLDDIQDPGNLGTLIRSAVGFGFQTIIASPNTVDFYNDKTIRATQGNLFYANLLRQPLVETIQELKAHGYTIYTTSLGKKAHSIKQIQPKDKCVLVLGNEGSGVGEAILKISDHLIYIPTKDIESLNVAMAGSIIMYEWQV